MVTFALSCQSNMFFHKGSFLDSSQIHGPEPNDLVNPKRFNYLLVLRMNLK